MAEKLIGPEPIIGPGGEPVARTTEYAPLDENARMAIFGYNPRTGKAFTPEESAAVSGGYNPYEGAIGYQVDPRNGQLNVLTDKGTVLSTGATYRTSPVGGIVPNLPENWGAFGYDEYGRPINAQGKPITDADIAKYNELVSSDPEAAKKFAQGKGISTGSGNLLYTGGASKSNMPYTGGASTKNLGAFVSGAGMTSTGQLQNPYMPGTEAFTGFQQRESAYNLLYQQMAAYGLQALVEPLKNLVLEGVSPSEFTIRLRDTDAYKRRFAANNQRINKGLRALSEAEYIGLEDQYQNVMRNYGLPESYYQRGDMGIQSGFEKFIAGDVSASELEDRIQTAQRRVIDANPEVSIALKTFYPDITNGDILAYALDPSKAIDAIKRKITAAEIGASAVQAGLTTNESDAAYLARYGITKEQAQQGYRTISGYLPRAQELSSFYGRQVEGGPYTQASAEREVFNVPGAAEEERKRKKITQLEQASFSGQAGLAQGALARERAGQF